MQSEPAYHQAEVMAGSFFSKLIGKKKRRGKERRAYSQEEYLVTTLREVAYHQRRSPEAVVDDLARWSAEDQRRQEKVRELWHLLSSREQDVTALVCLGYDRNQMAEMLSISPETVKSHMSNIFRKLHVRTSRHLRAVFQGWDFANWWDENPHN